MIDLNQTEEQRESAGAIPPGSMVLVRLTIRPPKAGNEGSAPGLCRTSTGMDSIDGEFEVVVGTYKGNKIWHYFNVAGAMSDGQRKSVDINMRLIRAMVEAGRGVNPKDASPQAAAGRRLNAWTDLDGLVCPVVVGCEISKANAQGKRYVNNTLERVVTPDRPEYAQLMAGGETLSGKPLPEIPQATATASPAPAWTGAKTAPAPAPQGQGAAPTPAWSKPAPASQASAPTPPPPANGGAKPAPTWAKSTSQMDQVPF